VSAFVEQLLSEESLRRTGYFDAEAVRLWRERFRGLRAGSSQRTSVEMGLVGVLATQLWHHKYLGGGLCELPGATIRSPVALAGRYGQGHVLPAAAGQGGAGVVS
jgi:asparagine synthase (glutamine-hydrolysing)